MTAQLVKITLSFYNFSPMICFLRKTARGIDDAFECHPTIWILNAKDLFGSIFSMYYLLIVMLYQPNSMEK